jgi:translocator protein
LNKYLKLLLSIVICESAGLIGSIFTLSSVNSWYLTLNKPFFNPPSWIFAPVWTILYLLMGVSLYLVWGVKKVNLKWFWLQLALNSLWSIIFFGFKNPTLALIEIAVLWISILLTIKSFWKTNKNAAYLLFPYLLWVSFATILNFSIVVLNK